MGHVLNLAKQKLLKPIILFPANMPKRWAILRGFIVAIPTILIGYVSYSYTENPPWLYLSLKGFVDREAYALPFLFISPIGISILLDLAEWFSRYIKERGINFFPSIQLATAISALNIIVGKKLDRFGEICRQVKEGSIKKSDVFFALTQPDDQIAEIVRQFHATMKTLTEIDDLKVVLVRVRGGKPTEYVNYMPLNERPDDDILESGKSFFHSVAKQRQFICIPCLSSHIERAKKNSKRGRAPSKKIQFHVYTGSDPRGSMAGFPIYHKHLGEVIYVLTVKSNQPNAITKKFQSDFQSIWKIFVDRITLEHSLKHIKEYAANN